MSFLSAFLLYALATAASAQPWQWQRLDSTYYNPSTFPMPLDYWMVTGDLNGDGFDEFIEIHPLSSITIWEHIPDSTWTCWNDTTISLPVAPWCAGAFTFDLDSDSHAELVLVADTSSVWKAVSTNPWIFERRDDLLAGLPNLELGGAEWDNGYTWVFGDYDGDGLLNGVSLYRWDFGADIGLWHRDPNGIWSLDSSIYSPRTNEIYDGDFDHDGDKDIALAPLRPDLDTGLFGENTGHGIRWHIVQPGDSGTYLFSGPLGGDVDGDGHWEGIFAASWYANHEALVPGFQLTEVEPDNQYFLRVTNQVDVSAYLGTPFGTFHTPEGEFIATGYTSWVSDSNGQGSHPKFRMMARRERNWQRLSNGFASDSLGLVGGNMADLDGDGLRDILSVSLQEAGLDRWVIW